MCITNKLNPSYIASVSEFDDLLSTNPSYGGNVGGYGLNGIPFFTSASTDSVDPFYPKAWSGGTVLNAESVDACIGHPAGGVYHYHMLPPCLIDTDIQTTKVCNAVSACVNDLKAYALSSYTSKAKTLTYVGLAKDGRPIVGPYDSNGNLFDCNTLD
jgi:hypothetical protein